MPAPSAPELWGGKLPDNRFPADVRNFDATGKPGEWPQRYTLAHWAVLISAVAPGKYHLRCRTIDNNGLAQPMPRPFPKSGRNAIQQVTLEVEA